jgi:hypothetical protein
LSPIIEISKPSTVYLAFTGELPRLFIIWSAADCPEYFRYMDGHTPRIKFNLPVPGLYDGNVPYEIVKIVDIEIPKLPVLPKANRDRLKREPTVIYDPNWTESTASNFTEDNIIIHGPNWKKLIPPIRLFIDLHEIGHYFYQEEENCDLYAFVNFLRMGYNRSTAYYALTSVLGRQPEAVNRIRTMFQNIQKTTGEFSPQ